MGSFVHMCCYQLVWCACVFGGIAGVNWPGLVTALMFLVATLWQSPNRSAEARLLLGAGLFGLGFDALLVSVGVIDFAAPLPVLGEYLGPPWMLCLWLCFATLLPRSLAWLRERLWLAALLGAVAGPLTYAGAIQAGAAKMEASWPLGMALIGLEFGLATPLFAWLARSVEASQGGSV